MYLSIVSIYLMYLMYLSNVSNVSRVAVVTHSIAALLSIRMLIEYNNESVIGSLVNLQHLVPKAIKKY